MFNNGMFFLLRFKQMAEIRLEMQLSHKMLAMDDSEHEEPVVNMLKTKKNQRRRTRSVIDDVQQTDEEMNRLSTMATTATDTSVQPCQHHRIRHHRSELKHQIHSLRKMVKTLAGEQHDLQKQMVLLSQLRTTAESNVHKMETELRAVLKRLES